MTSGYLSILVLATTAVCGIGLRRPPMGKMCNDNCSFWFCAGIMANYSKMCKKCGFSKFWEFFAENHIFCTKVYAVISGAAIVKLLAIHQPIIAGKYKDLWFFVANPWISCVVLYWHVSTILAYFWLSEHPDVSHNCFLRKWAEFPMVQCVMKPVVFAYVLKLWLTI